MGYVATQPTCKTFPKTLFFFGVYVVIRVIFLVVSACNKKIVTSCNFFLR